MCKRKTDTKNITIIFLLIKNKNQYQRVYDNSFNQSS